MAQYYQHSGHIELKSPIYMLTLGSLAALIFGVIYGYVTLYIPFIYLNFIITLGFGGIVGFFVGLGGKYGNVRNLKIMLLFGFIVGLLAEYIGWVSWIFAFSNQQYLALFPADLFYAAIRIADTGAQSIFDITAEGNGLYAIWVIEAAMIVGMSTIVARLTLSTTPFCEPCKKWIENEESFQSIEPINDPAQLKTQLERHNIEALTSLKLKTSPLGDFTLVNIKHCSSCDNSCFLTVKSMRIDPANTENTIEHTVVENLAITQKTRETIIQAWQNIQP